MLAAALVWLALPSAHAQAPVAVARPATAASAPSPAASVSAQRVEITGGRGSDEEQRRRSTAAKIVIGREEIERYGDSNTLEILKRLPGITVPGAPGRGGNPRMRGMGGGYTQILIDGERIAPGFSLDSIPPDQIERIEILRAPTAETGARAIAGTINLILREGFRKKLNDVNVDLQSEGGKTSGGLAWTRNDSYDDWIVNTSLSLFRRVNVNQNVSVRGDVDQISGTAVLARDGSYRGETVRDGLFASARLQWRSESGESLMLMPVFITSQPVTRAYSMLAQSIGIEPLQFSSSQTLTDGRFTLKRINANFNHRPFDGPRLEWRVGVSEGHWTGITTRQEFDIADQPTRAVDERTESRDRNATLSLKALQLVGQGHQLVAGAEIERNRRLDGKTTLIDGVAQLTEFGENLQAQSRRYALYAQDEWAINPQWALHGGLRLEGIRTEGESANGRVDSNTSRVATPLLHAVWKPDEKSRDQVRASLTRSYRSPNTGQLIGRPSVNLVNPAPGANTELTSDSAGNPLLKPEVALGIDLAVERYLADGGVLSANLFQRRINDLIRNVVAVEDVSWSPGQPRFVSRPQNIGNALSRGIELEAKFRLDQLMDDGPRTEIRANASIFRSRVDGIPGPNNRLAEQPGGTVNFGADHRFRGTPLAIGGNLNHTPGYRTRLDVDREVVQSEKNVLDTYLLWTFSPEVKLRLTLSNLLAPDTIGTTAVASQGLLETSATTTRSYVNTQLRLEMKL